MNIDYLKRALKNIIILALCQMVLINSFYLLKGPLFGVGFLLLNRKTPFEKSDGRNYAL